jgi:hypothetical protein
MLRAWIIAVIATAGVIFFLSGCRQCFFSRLRTLPSQPHLEVSWNRPKKLP